mmetsp:Transcript_1948/g.4291  ORF Transcript_1948/g.4291 Transcript_1948/m.4291 type:complete len:122 (-) Transcript_1948:192-557(-)
MTKPVAVPITARGKARTNEVKTTKKECGVLVRAVVARSKAAMDSYTFGAIATGYGWFFCLWVWSESVVETQRTRTLAFNMMHAHENMLLAKREQGNKYQQPATPAQTTVRSRSSRNCLCQK